MVIGHPLNVKREFMHHILVAASNFLITVLDLDLGPPVPTGTLGGKGCPLLSVTSNRFGLLPADIRHL